MSDGFRALAKKAEISGACFHTLRHTCASMLLGQEVHPKVVQEMLGHSTIAITMDLYSHVTPSIQADAATKLDAALQTALAAASTWSRRAEVTKRCPETISSTRRSADPVSNILMRQELFTIVGAYGSGGSHGLQNR